MSDERVELEKVAVREDVARGRRGYPRGLAYADAQIDEYGYGDELYTDDASDGNKTELFQKLLRAIRKRKWLIIPTTIVVTAVVATEVLRVRPSYTASAIVEVRREVAAVGGTSPEADPENLININTKLLMFDSRPLLEDVVVTLGLDRNEKFRDVSLKRSRWEALKGLLQDSPSEESVRAPAGEADLTASGQGTDQQTAMPSTNALVENPQLDRFVAILEAGKSVAPIKDTQALRISFAHADPYIARDVANGLAKTFAKLNLEIKKERFADKTNWLETSKENLKKRVSEADQRLANYSRDHNIFATHGQTTLTTDRLTRLHDQAVRAEMGLGVKKALYDEVIQGRGAQLPEAFTDSRIAELQKRLSELAVSQAELSVNYGPENPTLQAVQQQMVKIQDQIDSSAKRLEEKIKSDYAMAYRESQTLRASLDQAKSEAVNQDQDTIQLNLLKQDADTARSLYNEFLQKANQANLEIAQQSSNVNIIRPARVPRSTDGLNKVMSIGIGFLLSLGASVGIAFCIELLDKTVKSVGDVTRYGQLPTLGVIPSISDKNGAAQLKNGKTETRLLPISAGASAGKTQSGGHSFRFLRYSPPPRGTSDGYAGLSEQVVLLGERSMIAEAYRGLRTSVLFSTGGTPPKSILITSGQPGEGKTTTVMNTAISLAQLGSSVLIIDADLRKPMTHKGFSLNSEVGLSTYLSSEADLDGLIQSVRVRNLSVLPCGPIPANPAELISSERMKQLLETVGARFDHVLIDSPPLMHVTDAVILSTMVDGVVLVVHGGKSSRDVMRQSRHMLASVGANIFGVVLNNVSLNDQSYPDFPYYSYDMDHKSDQDEARISNIIS